MTGTTFETAIEISPGNYETFISYDEPYRYVKFVCEVGQMYDISATSGYDTTLTLIDGNGVQQNYNDDTNGRNPFIQFTATTPYMYAMVRGYNNPYGTDRPAITLTLTRYDPTILRGLYVEPDQFILNLGQSIQLTAYPIPETATGYELEWLLGDAVHAGTVDENGLVIARDYGYIDICVRTPDGLIEAWAYGRVEDITQSKGTFQCVEIGYWVDSRNGEYDG